MLVAATFHVLVSAAFSLFGAMVLVAPFAWLARRRSPSVRLAVLLLPFAKLAYELARGVPSGAFFWARQHGAHQELGSFMIGFGFDRVGPVARFTLGARYGGAQYPQSAADLLAVLLTKKVSAIAPAIVVAVLLVVALVRLVRRTARTTKLPIDRALVDERTIGRRRVRVFVSSAHEGAPFAGGLFFPYICFSERAWSTLDDGERQAVVAHELAHLRHHDLPLLVVVTLLAEPFWFVPFVGRLVRSVRAECELRADASAVRSGIDPTVLASALVRVAELVAPRACAPMLAFVRPEPLLRHRVSRLLASRRLLPRWLRVVGAFGVLLLASMVLRAVTFGNP